MCVCVHWALPLNLNFVVEIAFFALSLSWRARIHDKAYGIIKIKLMSCKSFVSYFTQKCNQSSCHWQREVSNLVSHWKAYECRDDFSRQTLACVESALYVRVGACAAINCINNRIIVKFKSLSSSKYQPGGDSNRSLVCDPNEILSSHTATDPLLICALHTDCIV